MRIGFYAPLKAPDHPVPSGDRQMARLLIAALAQAGHAVEVVSRWRSRAPAPDTPPLAALQGEAQAEIDRLAALWIDAGRRPQMLFTYHPYYKAPDLIGPVLAERFALPYVTAEASIAARRREGVWASRQALVVAAVRRAALNLCFTPRDRLGLAGDADPSSLADLAPFIDAAAFGPAFAASAGGPVRLVTVAMLRPGDKLDSYRFLGAALSRLGALDWRLDVVGDGPARAEARAALDPLGARVRWHGAVASETVPLHLRRADILAWPGLNEAFGLCYLEAQASGVPVVAIDNAGTPMVIREGVTGLLTRADPEAYAAALARLITDASLRQRMGEAGAAFVHGERSLPVAAARLDALLRRVAAR